MSKPTNQPSINEALGWDLWHRAKAAYFNHEARLEVDWASRFLTPEERYEEWRKNRRPPEWEALTNCPADLTAESAERSHRNLNAAGSGEEPTEAVLSISSEAVALGRLSQPPDLSRVHLAPGECLWHCPLGLGACASGGQFEITTWADGPRLAWNQNEYGLTAMAAGGLLHPHAGVIGAIMGYVLACGKPEPRRIYDFLKHIPVEWNPLVPFHRAIRATSHRGMAVHTYEPSFKVRPVVVSPILSRFVEPLRLIASLGDYAGQRVARQYIDWCMPP